MLLYLYVFTLVLPLLLSFFDFGEDSDDFFTLFSLNKLFFFLNGVLLGELSGFSLFYGVAIGLLQCCLYYSGFKLLKRLEHSTGVSVVALGDVGRCYSTITPNYPNKVTIKGEFYEARTAQHSIPSFAYIKVVGINPLIVEEINKGEN